MLVVSNVVFLQLIFSVLHKKVFLITPPFTQLNTPYPATAYIKGFLNTKNISSKQADLGIEVILALFSKSGLEDLFSYIHGKELELSDNAARIIALQEDYIRSIDSVIAFLQGKNPTLALQICQDNYLPEAKRFQQLSDLEWAFGEMGTQDRAKHLATLYLEDISDLIVECVDSNFGFSRYAERLGQSANSFDELYDELQKPLTYVDQITIKVLQKHFEEVNPELFLISVPFPGNLYSAFRCAQWVKQHYPTIKVSMGGGFPNTELRSLKDPRVFEFLDFITLDDGEVPIEELLENIDSEGRDIYKRTFLLENNQVVYKNNSVKADYKQSQLGTPDYDDLALDKYISVIEIVNAMHRMWSDGRWNKLTMAHGCYWGKCTFCDISLDYIKIYEPLTAAIICDRIEELIEKTGQNGFHFVDEAAPPALMRAMAIEILKRGISVTWWANIRFEKSFSADLCKLLKASGCIAVSGGLEVASDRLLELIKKGVTVSQVAQVTANFTDAGIMVHAYLMYGFPTQTIQETVDSLEMVRQLFEIGVIQSGFWHQFAMTAHSPVGMFPEEYNVIANTNDITFANNDVQFTDNSGIDHEQFSFGLRKSLFNFMHGICFDYPLQDWFEFKIPKSTIPHDFIANAVEEGNSREVKASAKLLYIGGKPSITNFIKSKKGKSWEMSSLIFHTKKESYSIQTGQEEGKWLSEILPELSVKNSKLLTFQDLQKNYEEAGLENFELFWQSRTIQKIRENGLLIL